MLHVQHIDLSHISACCFPHSGTVASGDQAFGANLRSRAASLSLAALRVRVVVRSDLRPSVRAQGLGTATRSNYSSGPRDAQDQTSHAQHLLVPPLRAAACDDESMCALCRPRRHWLVRMIFFQARMSESEHTQRAIIVQDVAAANTLTLVARW